MKGTNSTNARSERAVQPYSKRIRPRTRVARLVESALEMKWPLLAVGLTAALLLIASSIGLRRVSAVSIVSLGTPITQNFDTLATSGTANAWTDDSTLPGWYAQFTATPANPTTYSAGTGSSNTGAIYSFGVAGVNPVSDRAFGSVSSGTPGDIYIALKLTNNTGSTITSLDISYTGEQWRNGGNTSAQQLDFQYQVTSAGTITDANTPSTGWTDFDPLDFVSPVTGATASALDGNAAANRTAKSANLVVIVNASQEIWLRWKDTNDAGNDHGLAIDDFSVTANGSGGGTPSLSINDVTVTEGNSSTTTARFTVSLSSPALAGGVTFDIATQDNTATTADNDYVGRMLIAQNIPQGSQFYTFDVTVNGDTNVEPNETFFVNVTNITGATPVDTQGVGTITNDDFAATPIHTIQGSGSTSLFVGNVVTTTGIVTGLKTNGFFIQTPDAQADADPNTSEGIFVFTSSAPPAAAAVGNSVSVMGLVQEFKPSTDPNSPPVTELTGSPSVSLLSTGNPLPAPITLTAADTSPSGSIEQLEKFEGMRVHVDSLTVIGPTQGTVNEPNATSTSNGRFYGVITGIARPFREPGVEVPDPLPAGSPCCVPRFDANPERLRVDSDAQPGAAALEVTAGAVVTNLTGPLDYGFRTYTIDPDPAPTPSVSGIISAIPAPLPAANEFTVGSFNMERFFDTVDNPGVSDVVLTTTAFNNRLNKASLAIRNVLRSPDILGVEEMENITTLQSVATKVNTDTVAGGGPNPNYQAYLVEGNDIGGIDVGFLVKASHVTVIDVTQFGKTTTYIEPGGATALLNDRPPLVLRATISTFPVTVIVNHMRSLSGVADPVDGNRVRTKRRAQAEFLANLIQTRQTADPTEHIISVGDYNAFEINDGYVDSMGTIKGAPTPANQVVLASSDLVNPDLTDLIDLVPAGQKYSFNFDGNAQTLDHELITQNLVSRLSRISYARNNADFPESFRNDPNRPERISDHDMAVAFFTLIPCNLTCPQNITRSNDLNQCGAVVTFAATSTGDCGAVTCAPASSSFFPKGATTVTCASASGSSCSFTVTVNDTQAPMITCPANVSTTTDLNQCSAVVSYPPPAVTDNCPAGSAPGKLGKPTILPLSPVCTPASGSAFPKGLTTVTCSVSDAAGNPASCSFTVTVTDNQTPTITCPANVVKPTDPNKCTAVVAYPAPTVSDNCSAALTPQCSPASGSTFPKGTATVTCTVLDGANNQSSCTFTVTVNDTQVPVFTNGCPANVNTAAVAACPSATSKIVSYNYPAATDNCPGVTVVCNPPTGSTFALGTTAVTCNATDTSGNAASCSFQVNVFSVCMVDDSSPGNVVMFNTTTGGYRYCCNGVSAASGRGVLTVRGCTVSIDDSKGDRRVRISVDLAANNNLGIGNAFIQRLGQQSCSITDHAIVGNSCTCD